MKAEKNNGLRCLLALVTAGLLLGCIPLGAQDRPPHFTVRYLVFVADRLPKNKTEASVQFDKLQNGAELTLGATADESITKLAKTFPGYEYHAALVGKGAVTEKGACVLISDPNSKLPNPLKLKFQDKMNIEQASPTTVKMSHKGSMSYQEAANSKAGQNWKTEPTEFKVGRTYSNGITCEPNGKCIIYAFCVLPAAAKTDKE